jgi:streptomycin 6-kinase
MTWLARLPDLVAECARRWSLDVEAPFANASCAWVAPVRTHGGAEAVLKIGMPHLEAEHEIEGLRFWAGEPTVHLLDADAEFNAMLLERCVPGTSLARYAAAQQDSVIAAALVRLWRRPRAPHPFRPLSVMVRHWIDSRRREDARWRDDVPTRTGLAVFESLSEPAPTDVLLATDLHAGNVLAAQRRPWLVIDPKPFVGDPAYDATQHLLNCPDRLTSDPRGTVRRFAALLAVDEERVRLWTFARLVAEPGADWRAIGAAARALAP